MIQFFRSLFAQPPEPAKLLGIDLSKIEGAVIEEKHFPRPQWKVIRAWIKQNVAPEDLDTAWNEVAAGWLAALQKHLGGTYAVHQSPNFFLFTGKSATAAKSIMGTCETAGKLLAHWLGTIGEKRGHGRHVVLDFDVLGNYYDYVSYYYSADSGVAASGGVFIRAGYQHIAMPPHRRMQDTLVHELVHNRLAHLRVPTWLNEGIAVTTERRLSNNRGGLLDRELLQKHRKHWSPATLAAFWSGASFHDDDGDIRHLSYSLAEILVDLLVQEFPNFTLFISKAGAEDAGESAAKEILQVGLGDVVATFLGPGEWTPLPPTEEASPPPSRPPEQ